MGFWDNFADTNKEADASSHDSRVEQRNALFLLAKIHFSKSGKAIDVRVRNLSSGGMMAESNFFCSRGDRVTVQIANSDAIEGRVSWQTAGRFGIAFDSPIDPQAVRSKKASASSRPGHVRAHELSHTRNPGRIRRI